MSKAINGVSSGFINDVIIVGQQPWDTEIGSNCKDIAFELSKTNRVLYVNSAINRITLIKERDNPKTKLRLDVVRGEENGLVKITDNLWTYYPDCVVESINWINPTFIFNILNKRNNRKFAHAISKALNTLGFKNPILFNDNEMFLGFYLKEFLQPRLSIYYARDYMIAVNYWKKHGAKLEPILIGKSDICFTNSAYLERYCMLYNNSSFNVGQGCNIEAFKNVPDKKIEELSHIGKPLIGYVGSLSSIRLNIQLLELIAVSYPQYVLVLVGPEDNEFIQSNLHNLPNVLFLGQKPTEELPLYIQMFDICINPQEINEVTIGNYPRKIDEYLAMGKPVVATRTITMDVFEDYVYLANNQSEFIELINKAFAEDDEIKIETRKAFAFTHTWERSVQEMRDKIALELQK
ncbi:glycosyltransferase [Pedobacter heparinus]|uniref:Glycosyl transferase group 1 n=1 Tax=Pedobacter heparinus (strain ATCC 13125 / DSM 2366 / CIP 104194 / JCM 7457 / NBRC 12017 / NCIMB 9290 / NRRL B-14731 / HIM 762-3) TaxID=485917 RepID=C6XW92_PEDHD|nr:glycosyltransferase [Pedobacter heparinus]ACU04171.1 glycosyl transferase group 1 [Pedobacter heparinus DSM 2366]